MLSRVKGFTCMYNMLCFFFGFCLPALEQSTQTRIQITKIAVCPNEEKMISLLYASRLYYDIEATIGR